MMRPHARQAIFVLCAGVLIAVATLVAWDGTQAGGARGSWTQWGGPSQEFRADSSGLAGKWPESGPQQLWSRELGDGYSAILVEDGRLYTMYRGDDQEVVIALDEATGETVWEHKYDASPREGHATQFGEGPRSTPLIAGDRIYTVGISGEMLCLNKKNGKVLWSHNLWDDFGGNFLPHGYSSSPIEYKNLIIVPVGGENSSVVAFNKRNGKVVWKQHSFENSYATPRIFEVDGKDQLVTFMAKELIGLDPNTGDLEWRVAHENAFGQNISPPILIDGQYLFLSTLQAGAKGLKLTRNGDKMEVEEIWSTRKIQFYHVTTVRQGDYVYGTTGGGSPAFMAAINIRTGEIAWRKRGFAKANCVLADGRMIVLDEDGVLYLTTATPDDLQVHSQFNLFEDVSWTVPTVVGKTMYVRDKLIIQALDLG